MRAVHFAAAIQTFGALLFLRLLAEPDASSSGATGTRPQPRWLMVMLAGSLAATVVSGAGWLMLQAADMVESSVGDAWRDGAIGMLLTGTYAGTVWQVRIALTAALILTVGAHAATRQNAKRGSLCTTALVLAAALLGSAAWLGHPGADPGALRPLHLTVHAAHMLAAAAWLGGLLPFLLVLSHARRAATAGELAAAQRIGTRFGNLAQWAVAVLLVCGIVNTGLVVDSFGSLLAGPFAGLLAAKVALLLIMLVLAAENRRRLVPKLATHQAGVAGRLQRNVIGEIALGGIILLLAGVLGISAPNGG